MSTVPPPKGLSYGKHTVSASTCRPAPEEVRVRLCLHRRSGHVAQFWWMMQLDQTPLPGNGPMPLLHRKTWPGQLQYDRRALYHQLMVFIRWILDQVLFQNWSSSGPRALLQ